MAKTYADSVKLPNLVGVPHPASRLENFSKRMLNVEGHNKYENEHDLSIRNSDRRAFIAELLDESKPKRSVDASQTSSDQVLEKIDEKLTTGYHGIKHLFNSNDPLKTGKISKEGFRYVLNQLCGYISQDAWVKLMAKFGLNESETISFDNFVSHFANNQRVKKEIQVSTNNVEMLDFHRTQTLASMNSLHTNQKNFIPELSATYCFSLIKAKAKERDFDPKKYLPTECFHNNKVVLSFHLKSMLGIWNLKLSNLEFKKLWERFDLNNVGGVNTKVFLRLLDYRPNELDEIASSKEAVRFKHPSKLYSKNYLNRSLQHSLGLQRNLTNLDEIKNSAVINPKTAREVINVTPAENEVKNDEDEIAVKEKVQDSIISINIDLTDSKAEEKDEEKENKAKEKIDTVNDLKSESINKFRKSDSSLSENKIKFMVRTLKNMNKFGPNQDIVGFLNNKLNEGYISFKTAFEYIDTERLNHLLIEEFKVILDEFNVNMDSSTLNQLLIKYNLKKNNQLVDYHKFLQTFHEKEREFLKKKQLPKHVEHNEQLKFVEKRLTAIFQENFLSTFQLFRDSIGSTNQHRCAQSYFKRLLEQKFSIVIDSKQFQSLMEFLNEKTDLTEVSGVKSLGSIEWLELFKKFTELDPWKYLKNVCDRNYKQLKNSSHKESDNSKLNLLSSKTENKLFEKEAVIKEEVSRTPEEKKNEIYEKKSDDELAFSEDETSKLFNHSSSDDECNETYIYNETSSKKSSKFLKKVLKNNYSELNKDFKDKESKIKHLEKRLGALFRIKFHSINKYFSILNEHQTEKINKTKFKALMLKLGMNLSNSDIDLIWKDFEDSIPFSNLVRRFFKPDEFYRLRTIKHKIKLEKKIKDDIEKFGKPSNRNETKDNSMTMFEVNSTGAILSVPSHDLNTGREKPKCPSYILDKARLSIVFNWKDLKKEFQKKDKNNSANLSNTFAMDLMKKYKIDLSSDELLELVKEFNTNMSEFNYVRFLKQFNPNKSYSKEGVEFNPNPIINNIAKQIIKKARDNNKMNHKQTQSVPAAINILTDSDLADLKVLFKKYDPTRKGYLTHIEFKNLLNFCQINLNLDEEYAMLSEYDPELKSIFSYNLLLKSLIEKLFD